MSWDSRPHELDPNLTFQALRGIGDANGHRPFLWPEQRRRARAGRRAIRWRRRWATARTWLGYLRDATVLIVAVGMVLGAVALWAWRD